MKPKFFTCASVYFFPFLERNIFYQNEDGFSVEFKAITSTEASLEFLVLIQC